MTWSSPAPSAIQGQTELVVTDADGNEVVHHAEPWFGNTPLSPHWCGDVLRDGSLALGYSYYTGGASGCCSIMYVVLLPGGERILDGHAGYAEPIEGAAGPLPLRSGVLLWPADISHAAARGLPEYLRFDGEGYVEATRSFPGSLRSALSDANTELNGWLSQPARGLEEDRREQAIVAYALASLVGEGDSWLAQWSGRLPADDRAWLQAQRPWLASFLAENFH